MNMMGVACGGFGVGRRRVEASRATRAPGFRWVVLVACGETESRDSWVETIVRIRRCLCSLRGRAGWAAVGQSWMPTCVGMTGEGWGRCGVALLA